LNGDSLFDGKFKGGGAKPPTRRREVLGVNAILMKGGEKERAEHESGEHLRSEKPIEAGETGKEAT